MSVACAIQTTCRIHRLISTTKTDTRQSPSIAERPSSTPSKSSCRIEASALGDTINELSALALAKIAAKI